MVGVSTEVYTQKCNEETKERCLVPLWEVLLERKGFLEEKMVELNHEGRRGLQPLEKACIATSTKSKVEMKKHLTMYRQTLPFSSLPCVASC